jgi:hypothetical protein
MFAQKMSILSKLKTVKFQKRIRKIYLPVNLQLDLTTKCPNVNDVAKQFTFHLDAAIVSNLFALTMCLQKITSAQSDTGFAERLSRNLIY